MWQIQFQEKLIPPSLKTVSKLHKWKKNYFEIEQKTDDAHIC